VAALRARADAIRKNAEDARRFYETLAGEEKTDLLSTLEAIEALARAPGLRPGGRQLKREPLEGAPLERVTVTVPLQGSYSQLVGFLSGVERSARFLTIDRVALRGDPEETATLQVQIGTYLRRAREEKPRGRS
jgi:Tfp pilus assembly protein PilO